MLPNHRLSVVPNYAPYLAPRNRTKSPLVDYHIGPSAIEDASAGLRVKSWTGRYANGAVSIWATGVLPVEILTVADVANFSFCFDQDARPVVAYELTGGGSALYWYNPVAEEYETLSLPGARSPRVTLDDSRPDTIADSDVLCTFMIGTALYFREQRDLFEVAYLLRDGLGAKNIGRFGMNERLSVQWEMVSSYASDPPAPQPTLLRAIDTYPFGGMSSPGLGVWLAAAGEAANWPGCSIDISRDGGSTWEFVGTVTAAATVGELAAMLPDHTDASPDETNTLEVQLHTFGAGLSSIAPANLTPPDNLAIVEAEQLQFSDATLTGPGAYDLEYLLRGRNGTAHSAHASASRFVVLDGTRLLFVPLLEGDVGEVLDFRATTIGAPGPSGTDSLTFQGLSAAGS